MKKKILEKLLNIQTQIRQTGWGKSAKKINVLGLLFRTLHSKSSVWTVYSPNTHDVVRSPAG